ncbi:hypothetical protein E5Q_03625 [Mixia osmundae IAM 14324]|uniref:Rab-GAP TBC domain-containing protein n=1 Tax=Mixia osmundae (strain CBS 9802 / IAM 14324 / JCM 22182 / KY 12970) TaxID=764103 RepID=G7E291_MIXOS|nr:hypothetical protein E5Q_03625 [Mixia osmundae IAM 14324]
MSYASPSPFTSGPSSHPSVQRAHSSSSQVHLSAKGYRAASSLKDEWEEDAWNEGSDDEADYANGLERTAVPLDSWQQPHLGEPASTSSSKSERSSSVGPSLTIPSLKGKGRAPSPLSPASVIASDLSRPISASSSESKPAASWSIWDYSPLGRRQEPQPAQRRESGLGSDTRPDDGLPAAGGSGRSTPTLENRRVASAGKHGARSYSNSSSWVTVDAINNRGDDMDESQLRMVDGPNIEGLMLSDPTPLLTRKEMEDAMRPDIDDILADPMNALKRLRVDRNGEFVRQADHLNALSSSATSNVADQSYDSKDDDDSGDGVTFFESPANAQERRDRKNKEKFVTCLSAESIDLTQLRKLAWSGVPDELRPAVWQLLLGYLPGPATRRAAALSRKRQEYAEAVRLAFSRGEANLDPAIWHQIHIDVPRTNPGVRLWQFEATQKALERILYVWAIRHPASGYVQGINDLVTPFMQVFISSYIDADPESYDVSVLPAHVLSALEADSYWCLSKLLDGIQDNYIFAQPGIQRQVARLKELCKRVDAPLAAHLEEHNVEFIQFAFRWINCLLMREMKVKNIIRLWDTYLAEGTDAFSDFHLYVCLAFLVKWSDKLRSLDFQGIIMFLQSLPSTQTWTDTTIRLLLSEAFLCSLIIIQLMGRYYSSDRYAAHDQAAGVNARFSLILPSGYDLCCIILADLVTRTWLAPLLGSACEQQQICLLSCLDTLIRTSIATMVAMTLKPRPAPSPSISRQDHASLTTPVEPNITRTGSFGLRSDKPRSALGLMRRMTGTASPSPSTPTLDKGEATFAPLPRRSRSIGPLDSMSSSVASALPTLDVSDSLGGKRSLSLTRLGRSTSDERKSRSHGFSGLSPVNSRDGASPHHVDMRPAEPVAATAMQESYVSKVAQRLSDAINKVFPAAPASLGVSVISSTPAQSASAHTSGPSVTLNNEPVIVWRGRTAPLYARAKAVGDLIASELNDAMHDQYLLRSLLRSAVLKTLAIYLSRLESIVILPSADPGGILYVAKTVKEADAAPLAQRFDFEIVRCAWVISASLDSVTRDKAGMQVPSFLSDTLKPWKQKLDGLINRIMTPFVVELKAHGAAIVGRACLEDHTSSASPPASVPGSPAMSPSAAAANSQFRLPALSRTSTPTPSITSVTNGHTTALPAYLRELSAFLEAVNRTFDRLALGDGATRWLVTLSSHLIWKFMLNASARPIGNVINSHAFEDAIENAHIKRSMPGKALLARSSYHMPTLASHGMSSVSGKPRLSPPLEHQKPDAILSPEAASSAVVVAETESFQQLMTAFASRVLYPDAHRSCCHQHRSRLLRRKRPQNAVLDVNGEGAIPLTDRSPPRSEDGCPPFSVCDSLDDIITAANQDDIHNDLAKEAMYEALIALAATLVIFRLRSKPDLLKKGLQLVAPPVTASVAAEPLTPAKLLSETDALQSVKPDEICRHIKEALERAPSLILLHALAAMILTKPTETATAELEPVELFRLPHELWKISWADYVKMQKGFATAEEWESEISWEMDSEVKRLTLIRPRLESHSYWNGMSVWLELLSLAVLTV